MKALAQLVSVIFHPLLMLTYGFMLLLWLNPQAFGVTDMSQHVVLILRIFFPTFLIPAFAVLMMYMLELIKDLQMRDKQDRTGPYIITGVFYLWMFWNLKANPDFPYIFKIFMLGATIALFMAFFVNIFSKISMHTVGIGGLLGMIILLMMNNVGDILGPFKFYSYVDLRLLLMGVVLIAGLVGSARLYLGAHDSSDLYGGYVVGFGTQFVALTILT